MNDIILISYYLVGLFQERLKNINTAHLTCLLYLLEGYYMSVYDEDKLFKEDFKIDMSRHIFKSIR